MRTQLSVRAGFKPAPTLLTAILALATAFTLSCSGGDDDSGGGIEPGNPGMEADNSSSSGGNVGGGQNSSSSGGGTGGGNSSSSSVNESYRYYDPYATTAQRCQNEFVESKCGDGWYSPQTHMCVSNQVMTFVEYLIRNGYELCGNSWYNPSTSNQCLSGVVLNKCGDDWYNSQTQICVSNQVMIATEYYISLGYELCGSSWYNPASTTQRCQNEVFEYKCGDGWYNSTTQVCHSETIDGTASQTVIDKERCGTSNSVIPNKCFVSQNTYNPETQRCGSGGVVETKCGANYYYIPEDQTHFCSGDIVYSKCGGNTYTPSTQYCKDDTVENYDASLSFIDSRDGKTYRATIIGSGEIAQIWMAENLNYRGIAPDTVGTCYNNNPANCTAFGRLYDWETAMAGSASSAANPSDVQGICPDGWHLPSVAEWDALATAVGGSSNAGTKLKAAGGWGTSGGTDDYGFSALPGGYKSGSSFSSVGTRGSWWSATENDVNQARYRYMSNSASMSSDYYSKTNYSYSVRCVKD